MERVIFHKDGLVRVALTPQECVRLDHSGWRQIPENLKTVDASPAEASSAEQSAESVTDDAEPHASTPSAEASDPTGEATDSTTDPEPADSTSAPARRRTRKSP